MRRGNLLIYSAADNFCVWPQAQPRFQRYQLQPLDKHPRRGPPAHASKMLSLELLIRVVKVPVRV
jgi:hypothetical protein